MVCALHQAWKLGLLDYVQGDTRAICVAVQAWVVGGKS